MRSLKVSGVLKSRGGVAICGKLFDAPEEECITQVNEFIRKDDIKILGIRNIPSVYPQNVAAVVVYKREEILT